MPVAPEEEDFGRHATRREDPRIFQTRGTGRLWISAVVHGLEIGYNSLVASDLFTPIEWAGVFDPNTESFVRRRPRAIQGEARKWVGTDPYVLNYAFNSG